MDARCSAAAIVKVVSAASLSPSPVAPVPTIFQVVLADGSPECLGQRQTDHGTRWSRQGHRPTEFGLCQPSCSSQGNRLPQEASGRAGCYHDECGCSGSSSYCEADPLNCCTRKGHHEPIAISGNWLPAAMPDKRGGPATLKMEIGEKDPAPPLATTESVI